VHKPLKTPVAIDIMFNDVRSANSPPLEFWAQVTYAITDEDSSEQFSVVQVRALNAEPFVAEYLANLPSYPPDRPPSYWFTATPVPTDIDTYVVYSWQMPSSGKLLGFDKHRILTAHSHSLMASHQIVFNAPMEAVTKALYGLGTRVPSMSDPRVFNCLWTPAEGLSGTQVSKRVRERISERLGSDAVFCEYDGSQSMVEVDGFFYDRLTEASCNERRFKEGDMLTGVVFYSAAVRDNYNGVEGPIPPTYNMHTDMFHPAVFDDANAGTPQANIRSMYVMISAQACAVNDSFATALMDPMFANVSFKTFNAPVISDPSNRARAAA
jgi:hypothetical protein